VLPRLDHPHPRILAGQALRGLASSALDLSDGLASDLGHILKASGVRAQIDLNLLPLSPVLQDAVPDAWQLRWPGATTTSSASPCPGASRRPGHGAGQLCVKFTRIGRILAGSLASTTCRTNNPSNCTSRADHFA
jgi:thiamine-monophosphate kinase